MGKCFFYLCGIIGTVLMLTVSGVSMWWLVFFKVVCRDVCRWHCLIRLERLRAELCVECRYSQACFEDSSDRFVCIENDRYSPSDLSADDDRLVLHGLGTFEAR